jgi:hypothetical protein
MESEYFWGTHYSIWYSHNIINRISGVIINVLDSSAVDCEFEPGRVKPKTIELVFVTFPINTNLYGIREQTGWLGIRIMC